ncbi:MAG: imidazole glycerol phosphate synthase subunit HisF [Pirellulaceae bacterium]|jgi:imidazole glycerol-phosphate synthase subunit HisF|nr:imidazole glycerol phosphate synthase subunit HisF [Pirellulaceae bacterium]
MLTTRIIPCLDCRDGRVVKGVQFGNLRDVGSPAEQAALYETQGADEIVLLDVIATIEGQAAQAATIRVVRQELSIPLTVGGGVRSIEDAERLLDCGADKVSVNTAAVQNPGLIEELANRFGRQCIVLAVDAASNENGGWGVVTHSGRQHTDWEVGDWCRFGADLGAGEILLTSWDRDGTRSGYCLKLLRHVRDNLNVPLIASGGANSPQHLWEAIQAGADAVLAASIFHSGEYTVGDVKSFLLDCGVEVRQ